MCTSIVVNLPAISSVTKYDYCREVEACSHLLASLGTCMTHLQTLISWSTEGQLFPDEQHSAEDLLKHVEGINMYCFYGRCLGFQVQFEYFAVYLSTNKFLSLECFTSPH
jgi:hypothetical protein